MVSLDLKDAYLQVPMHPESRKFLRFVAFGKVYQFKVLCFGLSTAPQAFTRVMAPVSAFLHQAGTRLRRYLDDWLIQASSREQVLLALESVLQLCQDLGIVVNWEKSQLIPSQRVEYLGVLLDCDFQGFACPKESVEASLNWRRILVLRAAASLLLAGASGGTGFIDPAHSWGEASDAVSPVLPQSVLGLFRSVFTDSPEYGSPGRSGVVAGPSSSGSRDFSSSNLPTARVVVRRLGRRLGRTSRRRVNIRPLVSKRAGIVDKRQRASGGGEGSVIFRPSGAGLRNLPVRRQFHRYCLPSQSGRYSVSDSESIAQRILRSAESLKITLAPQFIMGQHTVMADALSRPNQILGSEWTLKGEVFQDLRKRWPVSIDLFATSLNHRCTLYFSPFHDPSAVATDALLQSWNGWLAYAFPPWSLIPAVLKKLRSSSGVLLTLIAPYWPQRPWFPELLDLVVDGPVTLPLSRDLLRQPHFHRFHLGGVKAVTSCLETIQRFAQSQGFSKHVVQQSALARRPSSRAGYQARWAVFRKWCHDKGHSVSRPSLQKIADFLFWLRRTRKLSVSAVMGYRSMLSAVFRTVLPDISSSSVLQDLIRSFKVEAPSQGACPPS